ncbi:MAG: aminopeptidase P family protein [Flavobacteriales bacterium]|nr:aminopeptidase P family protein [Flavobacteriales bacterium]MBP7155093.1 aminopeptidase P family protein [Flavobacteriales bacterium]
MRYTPLSAATYREHRSRFRQAMEKGGLAIFHSNDIMPTSADGSMPFKQATDIMYLTGIDQEESVLLLFPDAMDAKDREILFVRETNEHIEVWEGHKFSDQEATELSGIANVQWTSAYEATLKRLVPQCADLYLNSNEHLRQGNEVETRTERKNKVVRELFPLHGVKRSAPIMHRIRSRKTAEEVAQMRKAVAITGKAFERVCGFLKPGVMEYAVEAEITHEFIRNGSRGHAYTPIIASGYSACVLHYIDNDKPCKDGDVILMDFGCEYGGYASDLTRCLPVNGKFTKRQRDVYNAVLNVKNEATKLLRPGTMLADYHKEVGKLMESELIGLGLLDKTDVKNQNPDAPAYKKYFMHGTSHFIGLDVHDVGLWNEMIQPDMCFTVEPGIYIREENLGIRLENDILVTRDGQDDLFKDIPVEVDAVEELMNRIRKGEMA